MAANSKLADVAERYGVSIWTAREWLRDGVIPAVRITKRTIRFDLLEVDAALKARQTSRAAAKASA